MTLKDTGYPVTPRLVATFGGENVGPHMSK